MRLIQTTGLMAVLAVLTACGNTGPVELPERDFGQRQLASLDTACEGIAGLTGQAILAERTDHIETQLSYVTAQGNRVEPTALTIDLSWPPEPVATCYPPYEARGVVIAQQRVAIRGLTLRFRTADGRFDETVPAKAWRTLLNGNPQPVQLLAVTTRDKLRGTWQPFPEYEGAGTTINFFTVLLGAGSGQAGGNVGLGGEDPEELNAAIFRGRFAVATWP